MEEMQINELEDVSLFWDFTRNILEDMNLEQNCCENLKSHGANEL
jgi:hypothetical protein